MKIGPWTLAAPLALAPMAGAQGELAGVLFGEAEEGGTDAAVAVALVDVELRDVVGARQRVEAHARPRRARSQEAPEAIDTYRAHDGHEHAENQHRRDVGVLAAGRGVHHADRFAVELGKAYGARVIAAVSSEDKLAFAKRHGAESGVVYPPGPFDKAGAKALADLFKQACGEKGADVIYDPVGGDYSEAALRAIACASRRKRASGAGRK